MHFFTSKTSRLIPGLAALALLLTANASQAQTVNLTAAPTNTTLPDGQSVPMWGYHCSDAGSGGATCAAANPAVQTAGTGWSPIVITVPYVGTATSLTISLTNNLTFAGGKIPTSLTIVGQLGGGLGGGGTVSASPAHSGGGVTWPTADPTTTSTPPAQMPRVQSFGTEVAVGATTPLTWSNLRPGTYLIESGTHPSIQAPMGLYGILVVSTTSTTPAQAYPTVAGLPVTALAVSQYDADLPLVLSEIDPVQNASVAAAVATTGFLETTVWSGLPGKCGNPLKADGTANASFNTCYPPAVNYSPRYYLVNGVSFDRTKIASSTAQVLPLPVTNPTGNVILRLVNAGLRMHIPAIVNQSMTLIAEDGNPLPGQPRIQNEVFMAAGKTYDVEVKPTRTTSGAYSAATLALFDRQLSLSTNNQRDGGMQAYIGVAGGAATGAGTAGSGVALGGVIAKNFYCVSGTTLSVTDPAGGLLGGTTGANGVAATPPLLAGLTIQSNGTFTYVPPATGACGGDFTYLINNSQSVTSHILECDANNHAAASCAFSGQATLVKDNFTGTNAKVQTDRTQPWRPPRARIRLPITSRIPSIRRAPRPRRSR
jgi:FtsP/CotA-like multicopper oxidase with cupredoxin domain